MPQYKRKNVKKQKRTAKNVINDEIVMKRAQKVHKEPKEKPESRTPNPQRKKINVIMGNKIHIRNKRIAMAGICCLLALCIVLISVLTPTGLIEAISNYTASLKFGSNYPVKLTGGTLVNSVAQGNHIFLVSTTNYECYNANGKNIFSYQHGYQSPIVCVSDARTMLYDQSGKKYSIYTLNNEVLTGETEREILAATIARNGSFALATLSDSYSSQVTVYNKNGKQIFEWYCADYIINSVILSPNGKTLAVSAINAKDGAFVSEVYLLEFNSADPISRFEYDDLILGLRQSGTSGFTGIFEKSVDFFNWKGAKKSNFTTDEEILLTKNYKSNTLIVSGRLANKNENTISVFDASGNSKHSFVFDGIIDAIEYKGTDVYILSEKSVYRYTVKGEFIDETVCDFGTRFVSPVSQKEIAAITDTKIVKLSF